MTEDNEVYTLRNACRMNLDGMGRKNMTMDYVKEELNWRPHMVEE